MHAEDEQELSSGLVELLLEGGFPEEVGQLSGFGGEAGALGVCVLTLSAVGGGL